MGQKECMLIIFQSIKDGTMPRRKIKHIDRGSRKIESLKSQGKTYHKEEVGGPNKLLELDFCTQISCELLWTLDSVLRRLH